MLFCSECEPVRQTLQGWNPTNEPNPILFDDFYDEATREAAEDAPDEEIENEFEIDIPIADLALPD